MWIRLFCIGVLLTSGILDTFAQQKPPILSQELLFPPQEKHVHGSSVVALPNGDLLACWFEGSGERTADDVVIRGARLRKGSRQWTKPFLMADTPHLPDCNPVLFLNKKGTLFLVWIAVQGNQWEGSILRIKTANDYLEADTPRWNGQELLLLKPDASFATEVAAKLKALPEHGIGWAGYAPKYDQLVAEAAKDPIKRSIGWMTRIKPLLLSSGRIVLPLYSDGYNLSIMALSDDDGQTWLPSLPLVGRGPIQPALIQRTNGELVAYLRDSGDEPTRVQWSTSTDQGMSWTPALKTDIPNTASVELLKLSDGRWAFVGNMQSDSRHRLSFWLSEDEGKSWKWKSLLEDGPQEGRFSYPCLIQTPDGLVHVTYSYHLTNDQKSIKHLTLDPAAFR
jgi:predicted neuraminidase